MQSTEPRLIKSAVEKLDPRQHRPTVHTEVPKCTTLLFGRTEPGCNNSKATTEELGCPKFLENTNALGHAIRNEGDAGPKRLPPNRKKDESNQPALLDTKAKPIHVKSSTDDEKSKGASLLDANPEPNRT